MKRHLPKHVHKGLARAHSYVSRLNLLWQMNLQLHGATEKDQEVLRTSLRRAVFDLAHDLDHYRYPTLIKDALITANKLGTFQVRALSDDLAHIVPTFQRYVFDKAKQFAIPGGIVIDAGANIGAVTVHLSKLVGPNGKVISIEMMPDTASVFRQTIDTNSLQNVHFIQKALSSESGKTVTAKVVSGLHGQASIVRNENRPGLIDVSVETITLDEVSAEYDEIAFIKMDLEGAEPLALAGAVETLKRTRSLLVEVWDPEADVTPRLLIQAGFNLSIKGREVLALRNP